MSGLAVVLSCKSNESPFRLAHLQTQCIVAMKNEELIQGATEKLREPQSLALHRMTA